jgi:hypothetical protein
VSARDYYNTVRKERPDKLKPKTIVALLRMLEDNDFIYRTRVSVEESIVGITRKLIQLFWIHRKQIEAAQRFVADWVIVIDGTFNINELRLPLLVLVSVLNTVANRPRFGFYSPARTGSAVQRQLRVQLGRPQLNEAASGSKAGPAESYRIGKAFC